MKGIFIALSLISTVAFSQTVVFNENFQSGIPTSWTMINDNNQIADAVSEYTEAWISKVDPQDINDTVASATSYFTSAADAERWLISPAINLSSFGNFITWEAKSHDPSYTDDYKVLISTTADFTSNVDTIQIVYEENFLWEAHEVNLSELGFDNQTVFIAFVLTTNSGFKLYLDDVVVRTEDAASVASISEIDFTVFPNPAQNFAEIQSEVDFFAVEIYNQLGEKILETSNKTISTSELENGVYFVKINGDNFSKTEKLIVRN